MALNDPRTARDYLNNARSNSSIRVGLIIAVLAVIVLGAFAWTVSDENAETPVPTNSESSKNPSPASPK